jgi:hypothetical protein
MMKKVKKIQEKIKNRKKKGKIHGLKFIDPTIGLPYIAGKTEVLSCAHGRASARTWSFKLGRPVKYM